MFEENFGLRILHKNIIHNFAKAGKHVLNPNQRFQKSYCKLSFEIVQWRKQCLII